MIKSITLKQQASRNVFKRHTSLKRIAEDGWSRDFHISQTIQEASNAGFANCIAVPVINRIWLALDKEMAVRRQYEKQLAYVANYSSKEKLDWSIPDSFKVKQEPKSMTIIRRTQWTNGLVTEREVEIPEDDFNEYLVTEVRRLKTAPGILTTTYRDKRNRVYGTLPRSIKANPLFAAPYGKE